MAISFELSKLSSTPFSFTGVIFCLGRNTTLFHSFHAVASRLHQAPTPRLSHPNFACCKIESTASTRSFYISGYRPLNSVTNDCNRLTICLIFSTVDTTIYCDVWFTLRRGYLCLPSLRQDTGRQDQPQQRQFRVPGLRPGHSKSGALRSRLLRHVRPGAVLECSGVCYAHNWLFHDRIPQ